VANVVSPSIPPKAPPRKRRYAPLEEAWNLLEDRCPRHLVLGFHSYLRDWEISNRKRANIEERHQRFLVFARHYPEMRAAYAAVYGLGHMFLLDVNMPTDTDQVSKGSP